MKYFHFFPLLFLLFAANVAAQETPQKPSPKTPRETIVHELNLDGVAQDIIVDLSEQVTPRAIPKTVNDTASVDVVTPIADKAVQSVTTEEVISQEVEAKESAKIIAPFYLSAEQYVELRGTLPAPQIVLNYEVQSSSNALGTLKELGALKDKLGAVQKVKLMLGIDYAGIETKDKLKIYDFKLNRILTVKPETGFDSKPTGRKLFDNTSLYAKAYRDMTAVRRATKNGRLTQLDMGKGVTLDAFWIESAMSWAAGSEGARPANMEMKVEGFENALVITRKGEAVFTAEFSDKNYGDTVGKDSLFAFAHLEWPLHPNVLRALYGYSSPPKTFEMLSYGPMAPKGQKQIWTLGKRSDEEAVFPLPKEALGVAQRDNVSPLVFMINEAVNNRALGGYKDNKSIIEEFTTALKADKVEQAWLIGQQHLAYTGGCNKSADENICAALSDIEKNQQSDLSERTQAYITTLHFAKRPGMKVEAINAVKAYLDDPEIPAFIVRTAAMARARMKPAQARASGLSGLNADKLLKTALAKDPYDPNTYVGLAQVLAANGAFEQSWDINDALRAGIPTANYFDLKINRLEKKLKKSAPGYFLGD